MSFRRPFTALGGLSGGLLAGGRSSRLRLRAGAGAALLALALGASGCSVKSASNPNVIVVPGLM